MNSWTFLLFGLLFALVPLNAQSNLNTLAFSNVRTQFEFPSKKVSGTFEEHRFPNSVSLEQFNPENWMVSIPVESIRTGNGLRDWHLMSKKYFNRKGHPNILFTGKSLNRNGTTYELMGDLTIKGITKSITLNFKPLKGNSFRASASIYSSDFDILIKKKRDENLVTITVDFDLIPN